MTNTVFDVAIIGLGVAGAFCFHKLATKHPDMKVLGLEIGRPWKKRRLQTVGWLGSLTTSDGKFFTNDLNNLSPIVGSRKANSTFTAFKQIISNVGDFTLKKDSSPSASMEKKIKKFGYDFTTNNHIQILPEHIHALSRYMCDQIEPNPNVEYSFDNEALHIVKQKNLFVITTENGEYKSKKIIIAAGRAGWRWTNDLYKSFGIIEENDIARFGIRIETNASVMKDFNESNCTITKGNELEIGPLSWYGTIIPEDHFDTAISAFRGNENRWKTDKVSFSFIGNRPFPAGGFEQTDRLAKLTFILTNDRIAKERISSILQGKSKISIIPEYNWLKESILDFAKIVPEITTKAYCHIPTVVPLCSKINIGKNLESDVEGMFVVGEAMGVRGLLTAATSGLIVADEVAK